MHQEDALLMNKSAVDSPAVSAGISRALEFIKDGEQKGKSSDPEMVIHLGYSDVDRFTETKLKSYTAENNFDGIIHVYVDGGPMAAFQYSTGRYDSVRSEDDPKSVVAVAVLEDSQIKCGFWRATFRLFVERGDLRLELLKIHSGATSSEFRQSSILEPKCLAELKSHNYFDEKTNPQILQSVRWFRINLEGRYFSVRSDCLTSFEGVARCDYSFRNPFGMRVEHPARSDWTTHWRREMGVFENPLWALMRCDRGYVTIYEFAIPVTPIGRDEWLKKGPPFPQGKGDIVV